MPGKRSWIWKHVWSRITVFARPTLNHPVQMVIWFEAVLFANLLSVQHGYTRCYYKDAVLTTRRDGHRQSDTVTIHKPRHTHTASLDMFPSLEPIDKWAFLFTMRLDGQDVSNLASDLPKDFRKALSTVQPLKSPDTLESLFRGSITVKKMRNLGIRMDECWGGWIATGNPDYLRPVVLLLDAADDFPVFQKWMNARMGVKGLNTRVLRGMAYKIAGWSLSSFQQSDPQVSDWLLYWENDANMSSTVRIQIASLSDNPAFEGTP